VSLPPDYPTADPARESSAPFGIAKVGLVVGADVDDASAERPQPVSCRQPGAIRAWRQCSGSRHPIAGIGRLLSVGQPTRSAAMWMRAAA